MNFLFRSLLAVSLFSAFFVPSSVFATDLSITAANVTPSGAAVYREAVAGAAITAGQLLYRDPTANYTLKLADANDASANVRTVCGLAVDSCSAGTICKYIVSDPALVIGATTANGTVYILSATAGKIAPLADLTTGSYLFVIGCGTSTTTIAFRADLVNPMRSTTVMP